MHTPTASWRTPPPHSPTAHSCSPYPMCASSPLDLPQIGAQMADVGGSVANYLWTAAWPSAERSLYHPFVLGLADSSGRVPIEVCAAAAAYPGGVPSRVT